MVVAGGGSVLVLGVPHGASLRAILACSAGAKRVAVGVAGIHEDLTPPGFPSPSDLAISGALAEGAGGAPAAGGRRSSTRRSLARKTRVYARGAARLGGRVDRSGLESCDCRGEELGELVDGELFLLRIHQKESVTLPHLGSHSIPTLSRQPVGCSHC